MLEVKKLPKKINEINYFKQQENGCLLYSLSEKKNITILCRLENFEIENDFCIDDKTLNMIKLLAPIDSIKFEDNKIIVKSKKGNYRAKLIEKPLPIIETDYENKVEVKVKTLNSAKNFLADEKSVLALSGIRINSCGDVVATDRFTAFRNLNLENLESRENASYIIVPKDFVDFINKEFGENEKITLFFDNNKCMVNKDNLTYISRLIAGNYPNVDHIFNNLNGEELEIDFADLKEKANLAKEVGFGNDNLILYTFENGNLSVNGENDYQTKLIGNVNVIEHTFTLSLENLYKIINSVECEALKLYYNSANRPIFTKENGNEILVLPVIRR